jgi:2-methylcitrate dehydratase
MPPSFDPVLDTIVEFTSGSVHAQLDQPTVHEAKRRIIDAIGCALGAFHEPTSGIARETALRARTTGRDSALIFGTTARTLPEWAAFANGTMVRCLDGNDTFLGGGGHPSDMIPAVLAATEASEGSSMAFLASTVVAYEVYHKVHRALQLRPKGWDITVLSAIGSAMGAARAMGLGPDQMRHAGAIALVANYGLFVTRRGVLSQWRGCASPNAAMNGLVATILASRGLTGPERPASGPMGMLDQFGPFDMPRFPAPGEEFAILESNLKPHLCEYHAQGPIYATLQLSARVALEDIESLTVYIYAPKGLDLCTKSAEKWHPRTRETADHSIPYILSATLIDGAFSDAMFDEQRLADPRIHDFCDRITIIEDKKYTSRFPDAASCRVEIRTKGGQMEVAEVEHPRGHFLNPMNDGEVNSKFISLSERTISSARAKSLLSVLWELDELSDLSPLLRALQCD